MMLMSDRMACSVVFTWMCVMWFTGFLHAVNHAPSSLADYVDFSRYHNHHSLQNFLRKVTTTYPDITHLYDIGLSEEGRQLTVIAIGKNPKKHIPLRPNINFIGNMHGNELVGRELLIRLIVNFTEQLAAPAPRTEVGELLTSNLLHVLVTMNPDGAELALVNKGGSYENDKCSGTRGRYNANNIDLNRDFPDKFSDPITPTSGIYGSKHRQAETKVIIEWTRMYHFAMSVNFHGGALVANYPFDNYQGAHNNRGTFPEARYSATSRDQLYRHLAAVYAHSHPVMHHGYLCREGHMLNSTHKFPGGITNGAHWYPISGGLQDYLYVQHGTISLTIEVSCCKQPPALELPSFWTNNYVSMVSILKQAIIGVKGYVVDDRGEPITDGVAIVDRDFRQVLGKEGSYFHLTTPTQIDNMDIVILVEYKGKPYSFQIPMPKKEISKFILVNLTLQTSNLDDQFEKSYSSATTHAWRAHRVIVSLSLVLTIVISKFL